MEYDYREQIFFGTVKKQITLIPIFMAITKFICHGRISHPNNETNCLKYQNQ